MPGTLLASDLLDATPSVNGYGDQDTPCRFIAGWYYGITKNEKRNELLKCFKFDYELTNTLIDGMEAYIFRDDKQHAYAKLKETLPLYVKALSGCGTLGEAIVSWVN